MKPELLAPAGDLEKLKTALHFGADAVYIGGQDFGLRSRSKNFTLTEMAEGIRFAHAMGKRVYVTANIFAHNTDIDRMGEFFHAVQGLGADALIVSDPGVFALAREAAPETDIHISTQANTTNYKSAAFWYGQGAKRVVLARELSMGAVERIHAEVPGLALEAFVHGAMCVSYSGRCLLSGYLAGRDANRGACAQPCRWEFAVVRDKRPHDPDYTGPGIVMEEDARGTYLFNAKDLCMVAHIPELLRAGITAFKIEGRVKSTYYVGCVVKVYREAIDDYFRDPSVYASRVDAYTEELEKVSHRAYSSGFYLEKSGEQVYTDSAYIRTHDFIAVVLDYDQTTGVAVIEQRGKFAVGDTIEVVRGRGANTRQVVQTLTDAEGSPVTEAPHPQQVLRIGLAEPVERFDILRKREQSVG